jgi:transposase
MEYVRTIWRVRDRHVKETGREMQHMQKALTKMNIQLANVIGDISGLSGQAIITVLGGERNAFKLADLADYRVKASSEEVARSLLTTSAAAPVYVSSDNVCRRSRPRSKLAG